MRIRLDEICLFLRRDGLEVFLGYLMEAKLAECNSR